MADLTGRRRFRSETKWGRERLILQVEFKYTRADYCGSYIDCEPAVSWRDATTSDLTTEEKP